METNTYTVTQVGQVDQELTVPAPDFKRVADLERWLIANTGAESVAFVNGDDGLLVALNGVMLDDAETNVVPLVRLWAVSALVTVTFEVDLELEAATEEEAQEEAESLLGDLRASEAYGAGWHGTASPYDGHCWEIVELYAQD